MSDSPSSLQPLTAEEKEDRDVKFLRRILLDTPSLPLYQELVTFNQSTQPSARMAELMADTCRKPDWRLHLQRAGLLVKYFDALAGAVTNQQDLAMQILRFAANCVIEVDENRQAVQPYIPVLWAIAERGDQYCYKAFSVILNICEDYEPPRTALIALQFHKRIDAVLRKPIGAEALNIALLLLTEIFPSIRAAGEELPSSLVKTLMDLHVQACSLPHANYMQYLDYLVSLLQDESVQVQFAAIPDSIPFTMRLLDRCAARLHFMEKTKAGEDAIFEISELLSSLIGCAADIAYSWKFGETDFFANVFGDSNYEVLTNTNMLPLVRWMEVEWKTGEPTDSGPRPKSNMAFANAALMMLGNAVQSDRLAKAMVRTKGYDQIPRICREIIMDCDSRELRVAAATLFSNLAIPIANKDIMRIAHGFDIAQKMILLGELNDPIQTIGGLKLLRRLLNNSSHNGDFFCSSRDFGESCCLNTFIAIMDRIPLELPLKSPLIGTDPEEAAEILENATPVGTDPMYDDVKVIDPHIRAEIGRVVVAIYRSMKRDRMINSISIPDSPPKGNTARFDSNHHAAAALIFICTHPDQAIKSEAYLALGLMSSTKEGAANIWFVLHKRGIGVIGFLKGKDGLFRKFTEEEEKEEKSASGPLYHMTKADRGNALSFVGNLIAHFGAGMSNEERESLKILLTIHGEMSNQIKSASTSKNQFDSVFQLEQLTHEGSSVSSAGASLATTVMPKYLSVSPTGTEDTEMKASEKEKENEAVTVDGAGTLAARSGNEAIGDQGPSGHSRDDSG